VPLSSRHTLFAVSFLALSAPSLLSAQAVANVFLIGPQPTVQNDEISSSSLPDALPDDPGFVQQAATPSQPTQAPANETPEQKKAREATAETQVKKEEKQRAGGVLPLFNVVISGQTVPLTPKQKFDLSFHTIIDPYTFALAVVFGGGLGELEDSHTGYGHGPSGLFKRIGASYADNAIGNVIGNAALPVVLHQDPRYYRKGTGSVKSRIIYSALTTFICYGDNGHKQFNTSNVLGNYISGAISNAYYPSNERGVALTLENGSLVTAEGMLGAQLLEFSPDFSQYMARRKARKMAAKAAAAAAAANPTPAPAIRTTPDTAPPNSVPANVPPLPAPPKS
jgi:hypothetical protein